MEVSTIGVDLAKQVFQVHGVDAAGQVVVRRQLRRGEVVRFFGKLEPCLVGMEACGSAHYWARALIALGHQVRLMPPAYVKPYVKRGKNDAVDAEACCEAVTRPGMRFVPVKRPEQQAACGLHKTRQLLVRQRTMTMNSLRGQMAEYGVVAPAGAAGLGQLMAALEAALGAVIPALLEPALRALVVQIECLNGEIDKLDRAIRDGHRASAASRRLATAPGVGPILASAIVATIGDSPQDAQRFRSGRHFAAWLGLTPKEASTGGKTRLGPVSKMGNRYLRQLLVLGATSLLRLARQPRGQDSALLAWVRRQIQRGRAGREISVMLANKMARMIWAMLARGEAYRPMPRPAA